MTFPLPADRAVAACWIDVSPLQPTDAAALVARLPPAERDRFGRYRHAQLAHQFLVGRLLIRHWLQSLTGTPAAAWRLAESKRGRPFVAHPRSPWSFNLAHSGTMVAAVLSTLSEIGVDLEDLSRRPATPELSRRYCSPAEVADIEALPANARTRRFLTYWTLKEAYLKARGLGIAVHLADVEFSLADTYPSINFRGSLDGTSREWAFELFQPTPRYLLSVAAPQTNGGSRPDIRLHALSLDALTAR